MFVLNLQYVSFLLIITYTELQGNIFMQYIYIKKRYSATNYGNQIIDVASVAEY